MSGTSERTIGGSILSDRSNAARVAPPHGGTLRSKGIPRTLGLVFAVGVCLAGCVRSQPSDARFATPVPENEEFDGTRDLLRSIRSDRFAERAGLVDALRAARIPDPVRIDFVRGTALPDGQRDRLMRLVPLIESDPDLRVDVVGCSDPSGSEATNRRISRQRARSVASGLRELGLGADRVGVVEGRGEACEPPERMVEIRSYRADASDADDDASA